MVFQVGTTLLAASFEKPTMRALYSVFVGVRVSQKLGQIWQSYPVFAQRKGRYYGRDILL